MRRKPRDVSRRAEKNARELPRRIGRRHRESRVVFGTVAGGDARISRRSARRTGVHVSRHRYAASRAPDTRAAAVFRDGKSGGHARRARFRAKVREGVCDAQYERRGGDAVELEGVERGPAGGALHGGHVVCGGGGR
jgi:hypothetical protein